MNLIAGCSLVLLAACQSTGGGDGDVAVEPEADTTQAGGVAADTGYAPGGDVAADTAMGGGGDIAADTGMGGGGGIAADTGFGGGGGIASDTGFGAGGGIASDTGFGAGGGIAADTGFGAAGGGQMAQVGGDFVKQAAMMDLSEIALGQLALERAQSQDVKTFAQRVIDDHTQSTNTLKQALSGQAGQPGAGQPGGEFPGGGQPGAGGQAQLPTELDDEHRQIADRLSSESGANFDREYLSVLVEQHQKAEQLLEQRIQGAGEAAEGGDQVTQWAQNILPVIQSHLQEAERLQQQTGGQDSQWPGQQQQPGDPTQPGEPTEPSEPAPPTQPNPY